MKYIFTVIFLLMSILPCTGQVITGEVKYTQETAREEVFAEPELSPNLNLVKVNTFDKNRNENLNKLINGYTELKDRTLALFSDMSYGVTYKDNPTYVWYYDNSGILIYYDIKSSLEYPYKTYKYSSDKKLLNISLRVSKAETFIYNKQGELIAHWKDNNCYDKNGKIIMSRKIYE